MTTTNGPQEPAAAIDLLERARNALAAAALPLELPGAPAAREAARTAVAQLEDYIIPRYRRLDAPLLAVVGGSTGAGKSTLVNALVGHPVTRAGAIRPTTRQPILLHHPAEGSWFADTRILPGLGRVTGHSVSPSRPVPAAQAGVEPDPEAMGSLVLVADPAVPAGLALLDAPDIDSVSDGNRRLAGQLLSAADLWLFVTTANRYADAVPWKLLAEAARRDITVAIVLDRVPEGVEAEVAADLRAMLAREGLGGAPLFVVPEVPLDELEMLPGAAVSAVKAWLGSVAADAGTRSALARRTLAGALRALAGSAGAVAAAEREQHDAGARLEANVSEAYAQALERIRSATRDGTLLRGEVLARWQAFVGTGEFFRSLETTIGRFRDRLGAFFAGRPQPVATVEEAIESGLHAVVVDQAAKAAEESEARWRADPAGRQLLGADDLGGVGPGFSDRTAEQIRAWQGDLMEMIRTEGADKRFTARMVSFGVNGVAVALMVVVFASTAGLTGLEIGIAGGSAVVGQKLLEAIFGEDAVRRLAKRAADGLDERCRALLEQESRRFLDRLAVLRPATEADVLEDLVRRLGTLGAPGEARA
ncbi:ABC transporter [Zafaria cholistanensis]|uniref:ABC transporter n=1 Tax=Zafaria cholistanensis TaxID=1682741 RepID=A0A5A7NQ15_9MICC|nr:dynamin family protein [Zafaria cholistanensis]GER21898.1 ABC transporter [Zafaria cholistanensis]